jgi:hypothetical protein
MKSIIQRTKGLQLISKILIIIPVDFKDPHHHSKGKVPTIGRFRWGVEYLLGLPDEQ